MQKWSSRKTGHFPGYLKACLSLKPELKACDIRNFMKCVKCIFILFFFFYNPSTYSLIPEIFGVWEYNVILWYIKFQWLPLPKINMASPIWLSTPYLQILQFFSKDALFQACSNPFLKAQLKCLFFQEDFLDLVSYFITSFSLLPLFWTFTKPDLYFW